MNMRPLAIISIYNEADILPAVLRHLEQQGCDVYVLDNWSTDLSPELVSQLGNNVERWPAERPTMFQLTDILKRVEEVALEKGKGRWVINHDADEIRRVPAGWGCLTLQDALEIVTITGYNAIEFTVRTFVPTDNSWTPGENPERHFRYYRDEHVDHRLPHVKAWFQGDQRVDLHTNGGHQAVFPNRRVCPHPFILKHYPVRSQEHGERKVLKERFPRFAPQERAKRWHVQYDEYVLDPKPSFICSPETLRKDRNNTTILTLTGCPQKFNKFAAAIEKHDPSYRRIAVAMGNIAIERSGWKAIQGVEPSALGHNLNLGIAAAGTDDVLYVRHDVEFINPVVEELSEVSYLTSAGIVSAQAVSRDGVAVSGCSVEARWKQTHNHLPFVCALLRRSMLDTLQFDEHNSAPTHADVEFTSRAAAQGFASVLCRCRVEVDHDDLVPGALSLGSVTAAPRQWIER
jgi:glycosyltransferase involved in cell wall biosynthesis